MSKDKSLESYRDCAHVMDMALKRPGLIYELSSVAAAINFRQRCYTYRKMLRQMQLEVDHLPGQRPATAYDTLMIRMTDDEGNPTKKGRRLVFTFIIPEGRFIDPDTGEELTFDETFDPTPSIISDDDIL